LPEKPNRRHVGEGHAGHGKPGIGEGGFLTPIERRMGVEDLEAAHQQQADCHDIQPVSQSGHQGVAPDELGSGTCRACHVEFSFCRGGIVPQASEFGECEKDIETIAVAQASDRRRWRC
jgi:hypothetical protein